MNIKVFRKNCVDLYRENYIEDLRFEFSCLVPRGYDIIDIICPFHDKFFNYDYEIGYTKVFIRIKIYSNKTFRKHISKNLLCHILETFPFTIEFEPISGENYNYVLSIGDENWDNKVLIDVLKNTIVNGDNFKFNAWKFL